MAGKKNWKLIRKYISLECHSHFLPGYPIQWEGQFRLFCPGGWIERCMEKRSTDIIFWLWEKVMCACSRTGAHHTPDQILWGNHRHTFCRFYLTIDFITPWSLVFGRECTPGQRAGLTRRLIRLVAARWVVKIAEMVRGCPELRLLIGLVRGYPKTG